MSFSQLGSELPNRGYLSLWSIIEISAPHAMTDNMENWHIYLFNGYEKL